MTDSWLESTSLYDIAIPCPAMVALEIFSVLDAAAVPAELLTLSMLSKCSGKSLDEVRTRLAELVVLSEGIAVADLSSLAADDLVVLNVDIDESVDEVEGLDVVNLREESLDELSKHWTSSTRIVCVDRSACRAYGAAMQLRELGYRSSWCLTVDSRLE